MKKNCYLYLIIILCSCLCACSRASASDVKDLVANIVQSDDEHVVSEKNGNPINYPNKTYGESFANFFSNSTWKYFNGT